MYLSQDCMCKGYNGFFFLLASSRLFALSLPSFGVPNPKLERKTLTGISFFFCAPARGHAGCATIIRGLDA